MRYHEYAQPPPPATARLRDLGEHLRELAARVREAVAEAVGETLSRLARDAAHRWLGRPPQPRSNTGDYDWRRDDADPWADEEAPDVEPNKRSAQVDPGQPSCASRRVLTGLLWAAGWCLRKRCPPLATLAAALAAVAASGSRRSASPALDVIGAAADVLALQRALDPGPETVDPD